MYSPVLATGGSWNTMAPLRTAEVRLIAGRSQSQIEGPAKALILCRRRSARSVSSLDSPASPSARSRWPPEPSSAPRARPDWNLGRPPDRACSSRSDGQVGHPRCRPMPSAVNWPQPTLGTRKPIRVLHEERIDGGATVSRPPRPTGVPADPAVTAMGIAVTSTTFAGAAGGGDWPAG